MKELVGTCKCCKKDIYCMDGFLNGVIPKQGELLCFSCHDQKENINNPKKDSR